MKIDLLYVHICGVSEPDKVKVSDYDSIHLRFVDTYKKFKPEMPHRLIVVCYNGEKTAEMEKLYAGLNVQYAYYRGHGFDIGAYQAIGSTLDSDFLICMNSQVHFHRTGWMEAMVTAFIKHGEGIYAPMGSYENSPHLRGPFLALPPKLLRCYPHRIDSREAAHRAESGEWNMTQWFRSRGLPAIMVTWDETLEQSNWRKPDNIFRRGDQSNCLVWERHTRLYENAPKEVKADLARSADGLRGKSNQKRKHKTITVVAVTSLSPNSHAEAIKRTVDCIPYHCEQLLISPTNAKDFNGKWKTIPEWMPGGKWTLAQMCNFLMFGLHKHIETDIAVLVQWDGYAINPSKWTDEFLDYDYIGAPWPVHFNRPHSGRRVGNGGFSIRSKKWLTAASFLPVPPSSMERSEDVYQCIKNLPHFIRNGCTVAPLRLAMQWSLEHVNAEFPHWKIGDSFGFHGLVMNDPSRTHLRLNPNETEETRKMLA